MRAAALLLVSLSACAQPAMSQTDPCSLSGSYVLDRVPIHQGIMASMDENLADLGDHPREEGLLQTVWNAKRSAFEDVRAQAAAGDIVPEMTLELSDAGRFDHLVHRPDHIVTETTGRWSADASCRVITIVVEAGDPTTARVEGDRIIMTDAATNRDGTLKGLEFDRVR